LSGEEIVKKAIFALKSSNMDLSKILSIGGKPGLYRMIGQTKNGFVVESLQDSKRMPAFPSQQVSALEEISIFTTGEEIPLKDVFKRIYDKESGRKAPDHKADAPVITTYFEEVLPEYDRDMVRQSDMRKVYRWYNELLEAGMLTFEDHEPEGESPEAEGEVEAQD
jgi:hypothetical protein